MIVASVLQLVLSNPTPGMEAEFNQWYGGPHLVHGLETPGILAGQRFRRGDGPWPSGKHDYLMIWELDDPASVLAALEGLKGTERMPISPAIDMAGVQPPTMRRRARVWSGHRPVVNSASRGPVVFGLYCAAEGEDEAFAGALLSGGLARLADLPGVAAVDYLTLADEQIRGNARKFPHGLLIELTETAPALEALAAPLAGLPHADAGRWMAIVFHPLGPRLARSEPAEDGH